MFRHVRDGSWASKKTLASTSCRTNFFAMQYPVTPDGRYFVVRGRLWRMSDPSLSDDDREKLVSKLMSGRRGVAEANRSGDVAAMREARATVDKAKKALGERGPVWWKDGAPDFNRYMARNTPYAEWYAERREIAPTARRTSSERRSGTAAHRQR